MTYDTVVMEFREAFPELEEASKAELRRSSHEEGVLVHVFFGDVLNEFLVRELITQENPKLLKRIFSFLEKMATSDDVGVQEVAVTTVFEYLGDDKEVLKEARALMGENSLRMSHEVERFWGRE